MRFPARPCTWPLFPACSRRRETRSSHRPALFRPEVVQAATKWKRMALKTFGCEPGQGIITDMGAVRKDYFRTRLTN